MSSTLTTPTIEVGGDVYNLDSVQMHSPHEMYQDQFGRSAVVQVAPNWLRATTNDKKADVLVRKGAQRCIVTMADGVTYNGYAELVSWSAGFSSTVIAVHDLKAIPATPTLDEPTAPADIDWSEIRSATEARDWRRAWQAVGTDHTGDATPGETYLLSKAARAKATAAALVAWRQDAHVLYSSALANRDALPQTSAHALRELATCAAWQRIKRIAGWTSQARAQYKPRASKAQRARGATFDGVEDNPLSHSILGGRYSTVNVGDFVVADDVDSFEQALALSLADYRAADEDAAMTRGNGGITGTVTIPPSTSRSIVAMLATQARLTGSARLNIGTEDESITITPSGESAADFMARGGPVGAIATSHVGIATHATNPNPRGPQTRRRNRT
jgi:hypothetical protein